MKQVIKSLPGIGPIAMYFYRTWIKKPAPFTTSMNYWDSRYEAGGNSGAGSYNELAQFKADILNDFVRSDDSIRSVIEYGCGDGNQLKIAEYPSYLGFDVSPKAISVCRDTFAGDSTKKFKLMSDFQDDNAELTLSLDVIYHLVEDDVFTDYMNRLFSSSKKYVILYSSNTDDPIEEHADHVRHRQFTKWVEVNVAGWKLTKHIPNKYAYNPASKAGSFADFYFYEKMTS